MLQRRTQEEKTIKIAGGLTPRQPPAGYKGLVGIGCLEFKENVEAAGIRNLREVWRVWRADVNSKPAKSLESMARRCEFETCVRLGEKSLTWMG